MITSWVLSRLLDWRTCAVIALLTCLGTITYKIDRHGYNEGYAQGIATDSKQIEQLKHQIEIDRDLYAQSVLDSSKIQTEWQAKVDTATQDANNAKTKLEILRGGNQRLNDSLRVTTSKASERAKMPATPKDAVNQYNDTITAVFNDCSEKYSELAIITDKHIIDERQLIDSYPQSK